MLGFLLTSLVVVLIPGTGVVYTVSSAISSGRRHGLFASLGCTLGIVPHMLAAMLGLSGIMQAGAVAFEVVRWTGVAYLVFMGVSMIRDGGQLQLDGALSGASESGGIESHDVQATNMARVVWRGIALNLLNPKLTIFFFAFLPQFLSTAPSLLDPRLVTLGLVFMVMTQIVFAGYAILAAALRDKVLGRPSVVRWIQRSLGGLLVGFATRLAIADN